VLDIHNLERRWIKYKIKSYLPHIITIVIAFILLLLLVFTWSSSEILSTNSEKIPPQNSTKITTQKPLSSEQKPPELLEPSMDFVQSFQTSQPAVIEPSTPPSPSIIEKPVKEIVPIPKVITMPEAVPLKPSQTSVASSSHNKALSLNRNESKFDIESIENRFKETSNPNLGLFIARYYYDHGNFSEAYNFSLKTNTLNSKIEESWIIFSKSLVKLGKTDQAKKTLQLYISESNSDSARMLLDSIERGSFK
jgi:hypothetical protein